MNQRKRLPTLRDTLLAILPANLSAKLTAALPANLLACLIVTLLVTLLVPNTLAAYEISSSALVNDDSSLRIKNKTVHLYGIHIPDTNRTCDQHRRPTVCGSRAYVALDFKIDGFVRCDLLERNDDGSYIGHCRIGASKFNDGEDLSAYLLERGWALALPNAPFEYQALEKIARSRGFGVWGTPIDGTSSRP